MEATDRLSEIQQLFGNIMNKSEVLTKDYMRLIDSVVKTGTIPPKYKELIFVALSMTEKCEWCLSYHLKLAIENGVTEDELIEAAFVSFLMAGTPALMQSIKMEEFYKELKGQQ